jgi:hypothetical protein
LFFFLFFFVSFHASLSAAEDVQPSLLQLLLEASDVGVLVVAVVVDVAGHRSVVFFSKPRWTRWLAGWLAGWCCCLERHRRDRELENSLQFSEKIDERCFG